METNLDNREEELRAQRAARREQMRREKQRQEERRRMIKRFLPIGAGVFSVIIVISVIAAVVRKPGENDAGQQARIEESELSQTSKNGLTDSNSTGRTNEESSGGLQTEQNNRTDSIESVEMSGVRNTSSSDSVNGSSVESDTGAPAVAAASANAENTPIYNFESTSDTATIYSEEVISTNAVLINESTDTIVASKGAKQRISPASMTKVLTVLVAAEHIAEEDLDDTFTMTLEITDYAYVNDCSSVGFLEGEKVTVRDLFYGTTLHSGGDAAVGLATYVAGSHEAFVDMMNEKLKALGLADSAHFTNCVGLYDDNHYCTVYDMAVIMKAAIQNDLCREFLSKHTYTTAPTKEHPEGIEISNWFLRRIEDKDTGGEVLCAKTGYVVQSKNCAVSYGTFADGVPYICVTAGSTSSWRCIYDHVEIYNRYIKS